MTKSEILDKAKSIVNGERQKMYGVPEKNMEFIAALWSVYLGHEITNADVALMMTLFKIARCKTGVGTEDSFIDGCGYLAIGGEICTTSGTTSPGASVTDDVINTIASGVLPCE